MFTAFTPIDKCVGKEVRVLTGGSEYIGMLAGVYHLGATPMLVLAPMTGGGVEQHIPVNNVVVMVKQ